MPSIEDMAEYRREHEEDSHQAELRKLPLNRYKELKQKGELHENASKSTHARNGVNPG